MSKPLFLAVLVLGALLAAGCSQQKPAEQAVATAEQALADIHEAALKYVPGDYGTLKADLDAARKLLQEQKYREALDAARELPARAKAIGDKASAALAELQAQLEAEWPPYVATLPGQLSALEARITELSAAKKLPEGVDDKDLQSAKDALPYATKAWADAESAFKEGNLEGAVARARAVEMLTTQGLAALGTPPAG